ncbi:MAG: hypothetical protein HQL31_07775 [Planctomycetes bacterium]|nr:hypothetical protein [Planctomycetota bacterium]
MKYGYLFLSALISLSLSGLWSQGDSSSNAASFEQTPEEVAMNLRSGIDFDANLKATTSWPVSLLEAQKIPNLLVDIYKAPTSLKSEKIEIINFLVSKGIQTPSFPPRQLAIFLLEQLEFAGSSPSLSQLVLQSLISLRNVNHAETERKIAMLIEKVIEDATSSGKQKYNSSLHSVCIAAIDPRQASSAFVQTLDNLIKKMELKTTPKNFQLAVFRATTNLALALRSGKVSFKREDKIALMNSLLTKADENPASLPVPAQKTEMELLLANLEPIIFLLPDEEVRSTQDQAILFLNKLISHPDSEIVTKATRALFYLSLEELSGKKRKLDFPNIIMAQIKARTALISDAEQLKTLRFMNQMLVKYLGQIMGSKFSEDRSVVATIFSFMKDQLYNFMDYEVKHIALDAFFLLEPDMLSGKDVNSGVQSAASGFYSNCMEILAIKDPGEEFTKLKTHIIQVLAEITGQQFDMDIPLWQKWRSSEGRKLLGTP